LAAAASSIVPAFVMASMRTGRAPLEPEVLHLVAVEELLPEARGGRVRSVLVDRLVVVARVAGAREDLDLPVGVVGGCVAFR
jgi:hypothetical protein